MKKTDDMPIWVFLAFMNIETRKAALLLAWASFMFSIYFIPWSNYFTSHALIAKVFLVKDWSWFVMMASMTFWYWISLKWIDNNSDWKTTEQVERENQ